MYHNQVRSCNLSDFLRTCTQRYSTILSDKLEIQFCYQFDIIKTSFYAGSKLENTGKINYYIHFMIRSHHSVMITDASAYILVEILLS